MKVIILLILLLWSGIPVLCHSKVNEYRIWASCQVSYSSDQSYGLISFGGLSYVDSIPYHSGYDAQYDHIQDEMYIFHNTIIISSFINTGIVQITGATTNGPGQLANHACISHENWFYVYGGVSSYDQAYMEDGLWRYDIDANEWKSIKQLNKGPRIAATKRITLSYHHEVLYLIIDGYGFMTSVDLRLFNLTSNRWIHRTNSNSLSNRTT